MPSFTESISKSVELLIPSDCQGLRLDQALVRMIPGLGRRGARDLWTDFSVLVDGQRRAAGFRVQSGQKITLKTAQSAAQNAAQGATGQAAQAARLTEVRVQLAAQNDRFAALVKPAGMHSEALARGRGSSIEAALPELFPKCRAVLLNRLDLPVSGLILVVLGASAAKDYALWQDQGQVHKRYLAVVHGRVPGDLEIRAALDTAKRRKVRVLSLDEPDCLRWTRVFPLTYREESDESLVCVEINKGRRHQIRAHLAWAGHPVQLDPLYGGRRTEDGGWKTESWIYLHHYRIVLPGFTAAVFPDWPDWAGWATKIRALLPR